MSAGEGKSRPQSRSLPSKPCTGVLRGSYAKNRAV
eukprot:CAMPEP_0184122740 /NCGR_PEP_ID=MMETSP0974-20121125/23646_1 /TAXON_ID=483370 /ORGANISM="non described non described, Strain CCMP2097" /LENGTH=34 /DNA_ID= /DNA_START= /DNA_END= /DNA_ORIENTATION=